MDILGNDQARRGLVSELWIERPSEGFEEGHRLVKVFHRQVDGGFFYS
jgi:hypothetical protein